jgi:2-methylaconitate cis-trans-isomerase PrpF
MGMGGGMPDVLIPAVFMRGGTSKGVFFHAADLPGERAELDRVLLSVIGSPDPYGRQLNGMGGGISSLSKAAIIGPPTHPDADVDYVRAQIAVNQPIVDMRGNCGNLASAVGPFAVDQGLCPRADGEALVRMHVKSTGTIIHCRFPVCCGKPELSGDFTLQGVGGTGAKIRLDFLSPGGALTGRLLPTGNPTDEILDAELGRIRASLVDATNPAVFFDAADFGLTGTETPDDIEARPGMMQRFERLRRAAGVMMGLAATPEAVGLSNPKIAVVTHPQSYRTLSGAVVGPGEHDVIVRMLSAGRVHRAVPLTGAMCLSVACQIPRTITNGLARIAEGAADVRVGNPSGTLSLGATVARRDGAWVAESSIVYRTARKLMQGVVAIPQA